MNFFSHDDTNPFDELEKQVMSSGKVIIELSETIDYLRAVSCLKTHFRKKIALSIIAMQRIVFFLAQRGEKVEYINELPSVLYVSALLQPITQENRCIATHIRRLFLADLVKMQRLFNDVLDESVLSPEMTVLRSLLKPNVVVFGNDGNIEPTLYACFRGANARTIGIQANLVTKQYECVVSATDVEDQFFANLAIQCGLRKLTKYPPIRFIKHAEGNLVQESI